MRTPRRIAWLALPVALALVAAGCGGGGDEDGDTGSDDATANGAITIDGTQPEVPLVPANTTETGGGAIIDYLWTGLVSYPNDGSDPVNAVAESIETDDSQTYTVTLKQGTLFHDGTEVKAANFVNAWNWGAYSPNGAQNSSFFGDIAGFADVNTADPDADGPLEAPAPAAEEMSGLTVVDDYTFTIELTEPTAVFPTKLGYSAYVPLPDAFFETTPEEFGREPIGNGPVKFVSWEDNVEIVLTRFDEYTLDDKVEIKDITVKHYQEAEAAYQELIGGTLDFQQQVPTSALAGELWKNDLGDRAIEAAVPVTQIIAFPIYDPRFQNPKLRQAVSLAIDREAIAENIFFGTRVPADSYANPLAPGNEEGNCTYCTFDEARAQALLAEAGGFEGEMIFYYNADAAHQAWFEAVASSVANTLGIAARAEGIPTFASFRERINAGQMDGPYRAAWQQDYPDIENWLNPLYVTGGSSNDGLYSNPEVDRLAAAGDAATSLEEAHTQYNAALDLVAEDVPSMPIVVTRQQSGRSDRINTEVTNVGEIDLGSVTIVE